MCLGRFVPNIIALMGRIGKKACWHINFFITRLWTWTVLVSLLVKILCRDFFLARHSLLILPSADGGAHLFGRVLYLPQPTAGIRKYNVRVRLGFLGALVNAAQILNTEHCFFFILNFRVLWSGLKRVISFGKWVVNILKT